MADLKQMVRQILQEGEKLMPTIAEQWFKEGEVAGFEKGRVEGRVEGRQAGERDATLKMLRRYLATRFGVAVDHFDAALHPLDLPSLTALSDAAFEAPTLAAFETALAEITATPPATDNE